MADNMLQIHELVPLGRDLTGTDVLAVDTGALTAKVDYSSLKQVITADSVSTTQFDASAVKFSAAQTLTDAQKAQARSNISAASTADLTAETTAREAADEAINESLATKADADGSYDEMIVGSAEQLISTELTEEKVPYTLRTSGGAADIGNRETDMLVGGTIAWNQLYVGANRTAQQAGVAFTVNNESVTLNGTATSTVYVKLSQDVSVISGHLYYISGYPSVLQGGRMNVATNPSASTSDTGNGRCLKVTTDATTFVQIQLVSGLVYNHTIKPQLFDLTQMFGAAVADYIYSLEQATAGAGVAWFRALFRGDYYAYNAGELMSVQAASHNMVGFNQLDLTKNYQGTYRFLDVPIGKTNLLYMAFVDKDVSVDVSDCNVGFCVSSGSAIGGYRWVLRNGAIQSDHSNTSVNGGTVGELCPYVMVYPKNDNAWDRLNRRFDICVNLSDPASNGECEPYALHAYPLDDTLTLRGIPKLDANNALVYDGDTYASDGTVTRRYGVVDLGTLTWSITNGIFYSYSITDSKRTNVTNVAANAVVGNGFVSVSNINTSDDKSFALNVAAHGNNTLYVKDSAYTTAAAFKAAMSGVMLVYELATPTTETAATYRNPQIVDPSGTEEYVDAAVAAGTRDVAVPVGHVTQYMADLRGKLQKIPNLPTAGGTYVLKVTVTGGVPTYSWQAQ